MMMGLMARILGLDEPYGDFKLAFAEQGGLSSSTFAQEIMSSTIPLSASSE
jgi:hypothetical protein